MKTNKSESNNDLFEAFLIKEQELKYIEKQHAQAAIKKMAKDFKEREKQSTFLTRICDFFQCQKDNYLLEKIKKRSIRKVQRLKEEDKCNKEIEHLIYKHNEFKIHIFLERKFIKQGIIADCGAIIIPVIKYNVYLRIEYIPAEIWTSKHYEETFYEYEESIAYFYKLKNTYKNKTAQSIINCLTKQIDLYCEKLNENIKMFNCN